MSNESDILARLRAIATDPAARGLADDVALLGDFILTHDSIAEGVHFLPEDPPASVGWKLVAVNLSDLAAKGAEPAGALLSLTLAGEDCWTEGFLDGVAEACERYRLPLLGGDTLALPPGAPRVLGMTAIGRANAAGVPARSGARPGDRLWLVSTLGDSAAGLELLLADRGASGALVDKYRRPIPLLAEGQALAPFANAMMDVSDGLLLDLSRMLDASGCGGLVQLDALPLSPAFVAERGDDRAARLFAATGGDDYALLGAFPPEIDVTSTLCLPSGAKMTEIGTVTAGRGLVLADAQGAVPLPERLGHEHRTD